MEKQFMQRNHIHSGIKYHYKKFLSLTLLFCSIFILRTVDFGFQRSLGDLKTKACQGLNPDALVSDSDRSNLSTIKKNVQTLVGSENSLEVAIEKSDYTDYIKKIIIVTAPWIIFFILSILGWICYCCCCLCDGTCCNKDPSKMKGKSAQRINKLIEKYKKSAPSKRFLFFISQMALLFAVGILAICLAGFAYASSVQNGTKVVICASLSVVDEFVYGTTIPSGQVWLGYYGVINKIESIKSNLNSTIGSVSSTFSNTPWLSTTINSMNTKNSKIYTDYNGKQIQSPNPTNPTGKISSIFLNQGIGPTTQVSSMTGSIQKEIDTKNKVMTDVLNQLKTYSETLASNSSSIATGLDNGIASIKKIQPDLDKFLKQAQDIVDNLDTYLNGVTYGIYGLWGLILAIDSIVIIGILFGYILGLPKFRHFLHFGWCLLCFVMLFGFIFCSLFVPATLITLDSCDIFEKIVANQTYFDKYFQNLLSLNADVNTNLKICLYGTGDLLTKYNLTTYINKITDVSKSMDNWTSTIQNTSVSNLSLTSSTIDIWANTSTKYQSGLYPDNSETTEENPNIALAKLTSYTDYSQSSSLQSSYGCSQTKDQWMFNLANCTYTNKWLPTNSPTADYGNSVCINLDAFTVSTKNTRYTSLATSCSSLIKVNIDNYFNSLKNYDNDRRTVFGSLVTDLNSLKSDNDVLVTNVNGLNTKIIGFKNDTQYLINNVTDPQNGLIAGFNCIFVKQNLIRFKDAMCVSFLPSIYTITALIISASLLMFFTSYFAYKLAMVIDRKNKADKIGYKKVAPEEKF